MGYNPSNMYHPAVGPDTGEAMGRAIADVGKTIAGGIEQYGSMRHAAAAADQEFDLFQQMYPDTAALMDPEKFASANLAGKQKMLGMAKGHVLQQMEQQQNAQGWAFKGAQLGQQQQELEQRGGYQAANLQLSAQELGLRATEGAQRSALTERELGLKEREMTAEMLRRNQGPRYVPVQGSNYLAPEDANGNQMTRLPALQPAPGPYAPGRAPMVPVQNSRSGGASPVKIIEQDGQSYRLAPDGVTLIPLRVQGAPAGSAAAPAARPSFLSWKPAP